MSRFDLYDVTFEWSDDSETFHSYRADNFHSALAEATDDDDAMSRHLPLPLSRGEGRPSGGAHG